MLAPVLLRPTPAELAAWVRDARQRTLDLVADLSDAELMGPRLAIVNPLRWEIGHVAWFHERWVLRHANGRPPLRADGDALYDSAAVAHDTRWDLLLPTRADTLAFMRAVYDRVLERPAAPDLRDDEVYFVMLAVFHEDMHDEAFAYTRQTHGFRPPRYSMGAEPEPVPRGDAACGDVTVPGGTFPPGVAPGEEPFVFDNEKWAHAVEIEPFSIARTAATQAEFAAFVEDGGYRRRELWSADGWERRHFDRCVPLEPDLPVLHVNWFEAEAYCRWAGRRLAAQKRRFPWGDEPPAPERANLDGRALGRMPVSALPAGDSAFGCRQMIGNVWEWTADDFLPYPGFVLDPYKEYSAPWFGNHKVLRGGCWVTRARLLRNTWRNFYTPDRRDVWAGFRTCALR